MNHKSINSFFRSFFSDLIVVIVTLLTLISLSIAVSEIIVNNRDEGIGVGIVIGFGLGIFALYGLMGRFNFVWTMIQAILNIVITFAEYWVIIRLFRSVLIFHTDIGVMLYIIILTTTIISLNKQLLDSFAIKTAFKGKKKETFTHL